MFDRPTEDAVRAYTLRVVEAGRLDKPWDMEPHERPWWLRCEEARAARAKAAKEAVAAHLEGAAQGGASSSSSRASKPKKGPDSVPPPPDGRPRTPSSQLKALSLVAQQPMKVNPCTEHHREYWLPPEPKAQREALHSTLRKEQRDFGTKDKVWGKRPTDMRTAGWYVENLWAHRSLQRAASDPSLASKPREKQPWTNSKQFQSCCVGGVGGGKEGRNVGLYEDSFIKWKEYHHPKHGLSSSDVTILADAMVRQKALGRK
eukprot:TRINITY_DN78184_c0_g1_i1.p1 TRINITY_DN78184_c0_g1~~TRINITY_DN78184_c0_g1_i1.p1  ORF type:complete len:260 (+),score=52.59 TRINITY_DN78184_c0_g1_i1:42-821(+)